MDERSAKVIAEVLGGASWHSGGGVWLVLKERPDGRLVVISDEVVCEYASLRDFEADAAALATIRLC